MVKMQNPQLSNATTGYPFDGLNFGSYPFDGLNFGSCTILSWVHKDDVYLYDNPMRAVDV